MPTLDSITCSLALRASPSKPLQELAPHLVSKSSTAFILVPSNPSPDDDYGVTDVPYIVRWTLAPEVLHEGGIHVQVEVDGCQKGQGRCYEQILISQGEGSPDRGQGVEGEDDGVWAVADGKRRRPWVWTKIKTTHPHSALSDRDILARVGSVKVTFSRATVVPTSHIVPPTAVFGGGAPLPERMKERVSHWTKLGYIEKYSKPAKEVGLVAEELHETLASFTFFYRSQDLLEKVLPTVNGHSWNSTQMSELKFLFPAASLDNRSASGPTPLVFPSPTGEDSPSTSPADPSAGAGGKPSGFSKLRKRMSSQAPVPSAEVLEGRSPSPSPDKEKEKDNENNKGDVPKRKRAVSMRMGKRMSLLGKTGGGGSAAVSVDGRSPRASVDSGISSIVANEGQTGVHNLETMEGLKKEVIRLRTEVDDLKRHLNL